MTGFRELDKCIFCGDSDMTEEHLIAAWVLRAFHRQRKPDPGFSGGFVGPNQMHLSTEEPISTAKVICRSCNNEWLSVIDSAAADVLKPLIRGDDTVTLDGDGQAVFAAWIYKSALIFDAAENGNDGDLAPLREGFEASREAGPGCVIYAGPAPPMPFSVPRIPEVAGLRMFGIRPISGTLNLTVNVQNADGTVSPGAPTLVAITEETGRPLADLLAAKQEAMGAHADVRTWISRDRFVPNIARPSYLDDALNEVMDVATRLLGLEGVKAESAA